MPVERGHQGRPPDARRAALTDTVYQHLRAIAQHQMNSERPEHTLSATALVHEAYLRLGGPHQYPEEQGAAFFLAAADAMRRILIEHARRRGRVKRGGGKVQSPLDAIGDVVDLDRVAESDADHFRAFDEAFRRLEGHEPRSADVVRLRFFAGLSVPETARALGVSERTVNNRWSYARAWLARTISSSATVSVSEPLAGVDPHVPGRTG